MSADRYDAIVIGSGLDELFAAARLAKAGFRVLVLERGETPGGLAATEEILPGFRVDPVLRDAGYLPPGALRDLELEKQGVTFLSPDPVLVAPTVSGEPLVLWRDPRRSRTSIAKRSPGDADRWVGFSERMASFARILEAACSRPAFRPTGSLKDLTPLLGLGWRIRSLGREGMTELLRVVSLPAYDLLEDNFEDDLLRGTLAAIAVRGIFQGPRSPGTSLVLLHHLVGSPAGVFGLRGVVRGGTGALAAALAAAARERGVEIHCGVEVERIVIEKGRAVGVSLAGGAEIPARAVLSGADPVHTFLDLAGTVHLDPDFVHAVRKIRFRGGCARIDLALSEAPRFEGLADTPEGTLVIAPGLDDVERAYDDAKHGGVSARPVLEARIPSLVDPTLAPPGRHVMSIDVRFVPVGETRDAEGAMPREVLGDRVIELLAGHAPNLPGAILERRILTPPDLEARYGLTGGDPYQGELALDQLLFMRPVPGWARHRTPVQRLYLCGPGTHPAGAITGASGRHAADVILGDLENPAAGREAPANAAATRLPVEEVSPT
ncbi:MAG: phytoene desaturase family protein [Gemmatimonadota bacterium]